MEEERKEEREEKGRGSKEEDKGEGRLTGKQSLVVCTVVRVQCMPQLTAS